jgi:hypothetical protein
VLAQLVAYLAQQLISQHLAPPPLQQRADSVDSDKHNNNSQRQLQAVAFLAELVVLLVNRRPHQPQVDLAGLVNHNNNNNSSLRVFSAQQQQHSHRQSLDLLNLNNNSSNKQRHQQAYLAQAQRERSVLAHNKRVEVYF